MASKSGEVAVTPELAGLREMIQASGHEALVRDVVQFTILNVASRLGMIGNELGIIEDDILVYLRAKE